MPYLLSDKIVRQVYIYIYIHTHTCICVYMYMVYFQLYFLKCWKNILEGNGYKCYKWVFLFLFFSFLFSKFLTMTLHLPSLLSNLLKLPVSPKILQLQTKSPEGVWASFNSPPTMPGMQERDLKGFPIAMLVFISNLHFPRMENLHLSTLDSPSFPHPPLPSPLSMLPS